MTAKKMVWIRPDISEIEEGKTFEVVISTNGGYNWISVLKLSTQKDCKVIAKAYESIDYSKV